MKPKHKLAIAELMSRAAYGLDMRELDLLGSCFARDAEFSMRIAGGDLIGPFRGRDDIMKLMSDSMKAQTDQRRHCVSNLFFESEGNKSAVAFSNLALFATENNQIRLITCGVYRDTVLLVDGDWQLQRRHLELDLPY